MNKYNKYREIINENKTNELKSIKYYEYKYNIIK